MSLNKLHQIKNYEHFQKSFEPSLYFMQLHFQIPFEPLQKSHAFFYFKFSPQTLPIILLSLYQAQQNYHKFWTCLKPIPSSSTFELNSN